MLLLLFFLACLAGWKLLNCSMRSRITQDDVENTFHFWLSHTLACAYNENAVHWWLSFVYVFHPSQVLNASVYSTACGKSEQQLDSSLSKCKLDFNVAFGMVAYIWCHGSTSQCSSLGGCVSVMANINFTFSNARCCVFCRQPSNHLTLLTTSILISCGTLPLDRRNERVGSLAQLHCLSDAYLQFCW